MLKIPQKSNRNKFGWNHNRLVGAHKQPKAPGLPATEFAEDQPTEETLQLGPFFWNVEKYSMIHKL